MKKTGFFGFTVIFFFCVCSIVFPYASSENDISSIIYVGGDGPGNYSSIQTAIFHLDVGGIIFVNNGTYHENLIINKSLTLIGENKNITILNGSGNKFVVTLTANNVTLSGFTITNSQKEFPYAGIYVNSDFNTVMNTILTDNYYGIQLGYSASGNLIINNTIFHNKQCGIYFNHASNNDFIGNTVSNHLVNGFGLYEFSNNNRIINNTFSKNGYTGVNIRESYQNQVIGNTFFQDKVGLHKPSPEYQNFEKDNLYIDNGLALEEERDAFVFTVIIFDILVFFVFLVFRKVFL